MLPKISSPCTHCWPDHFTETCWLNPGFPPKIISATFLSTQSIQDFCDAFGLAQWDGVPYFFLKTTTESVFQFQVKHTPPGKVTARLWIVESSLCPIAEPGLQEEHWGFRTGHRTVDRSQERSNPVYIGFVVLDKASTFVVVVPKEHTVSGLQLHASRPLCIRAAITGTITARSVLGFIGSKLASVNQNKTMQSA